MYQWGFGTSGLNAYAGVHEGNGNTVRKTYKAGSLVSSTNWPNEVSGSSDYDKWNSDNGPCPSGWRLPTTSELEGLIEQRQWAIGSIGNASVTGYWFYGSRSTGVGVFFPAAGGIQKGTKMCYSRGDRGMYWTTEGNTGMEIWAYRLRFEENSLDFDTSYRAWGFSVRCVKK